ncbi:MAG TPA: flagellar hook-basal body complex protein FliE [Fimbriimonadaceae bacterium]|nr:flagellar hook-basal body complex protein FliE [Fimbriimonadaceae bacterium]
MNIGALGIQNNAIQQLADQAKANRSASNAGSGEGDFAQTLMDVLKEVNGSQQNALQVQNDFMTGRQSVDYHDLEIAMQRANIAMNLTMSVRNKMLDAYQEIERMQV